MNKVSIEKLMRQNPGSYITDRGLEIKNRKGQTEILMLQRGLKELLEIENVSTGVIGMTTLEKGEIHAPYTPQLSAGPIPQSTPEELSATEEQLKGALNEIFKEEAQEKKEPKLVVDNTTNENADEQPAKPKRGRKPKSAAQENASN